MTSGGVPQTAANGQQIYETFSHKNKCKQLRTIFLHMKFDRFYLLLGKLGLLLVVV